jgi:hypothetical protein
MEANTYVAIKAFSFMPSAFSLLGHNQKVILFTFLRHQIFAID